MKISILILLFFVCLSLHAIQNTDLFADDYLQHSLNGKLPISYYVVINIQYSDVLTKYVIPDRMLNYLCRLDKTKNSTIDKEKGYKLIEECNSIIASKIRNADTLKLNISINEFYHHSKYEYDGNSKFKKFTDSIVGLGKEYFLNYFFETEEYNGIPLYRGKFKYEHFEGLEYEDKKQYQLSVIYQLYNFKIYTYIQSYSGHLHYCLEPLPDITK